MTESNIRIQLDTVRKNNVRLIYAVQNDYGARYLTVEMMTDGKEESVSPLAVVSINAKRSDGRKNAFFGVVNADGTVTVPVTDWMLDVEGEVICSVAVVESGKRLTTTHFYMQAQESIWDGTSEPSADDPNRDVILEIIASEKERAETFMEMEKSFRNWDDAISPAASVTQTSGGAYIRMKDKNGETEANVYNGKSAYQYAQAGGYTGTETEYAEDINPDHIKKGAEDFVITELAKRGQLKPEFANSVKECTDISKLYVLPDGYIWAYMLTDGKITYTNLALPLSSDWKASSRLNASGAIASSSENGAFVSNAFTCKRGDILRVKGVRSTTLGTSTGAYFTLTLLNSSGGNVQGAKSIYISNVIPPSGTTSSMCMNIEPDANGVYTYTIGKNASDIWITSDENAIVSARVGGIATDGTENIVITINEEIAVSEGGYEWTNTGHAFAPADYEDRILSLENHKAVMNERVSLIENELANKEDATESSVKWCAMGDSITEGWVSYWNGDDPTSKVDRANGWAAKVAELNGWSLTNKAIGGTGYIDLENSDAVGTTAAWNIARNTDFTPFNLVTLAYGVNDWKGNKPLGTIGDNIETPTTIYGGMKATIEAIMASNPLCKIIVTTPLNCVGYNFDYGTEETNWGLSKSFSNNGTLEDVFNAIVEVCEYYGIEYIDMTHKSVVNRKNILSCLTDGVHPNAETHTLLAYELAKKIHF